MNKQLEKKQMRRRRGLLTGLLFLCLFLFSGCSEGAKSYKKGREAFEDQDYAQAVKLYDLAISQGETGAALYADRALALLMTGDPVNAQKSLDKALSGTDNDKSLFNKAGYYYELYGDTEKAIAFYTEALSGTFQDMKTEDQEIWGSLASLEEEAGNDTEALKIYNALIEAGYAPAFHEMKVGCIYARQHQFQAAMSYFDMLEGKTDVTPTWYLYIYNTLKENGATEEAETCFNRGLALVRTGNYDYTEATYYGCAGKFEELLAIGEDPQDARGLLTLAMAYLETGDYESCEKTLAQVFAADPDNTEGYVLDLKLQIEKGDYETAELMVTTLESMDYRDFLKEVLWNEIILKEKEEDFEKAYELLVSFLRQYPGDQTAIREFRFLERAGS